MIITSQFMNYQVNFLEKLNHIYAQKFLKCSRKEDTRIYLIMKMN